MKWTRKNLPPFLSLTVLCALASTLGWDIIERIFTLAGLPWSLTFGPVGFDLSVISFSIRLNPGTLLGAGGGIFLCRNL